MQGVPCGDLFFTLAQRKNERDIHPLQGLPLYGEDAIDSGQSPPSVKVLVWLAPKRGTGFASHTKILINHRFPRFSVTFFRQRLAGGLESGSKPSWQEGWVVERIPMGYPRRRRAGLLPRALSLLSRKRLERSASGSSHRVASLS